MAAVLAGMAVLVPIRALHASADIDPDRFQTVPHGSAAYPRPWRPAGYDSSLLVRKDFHTAHGDFNCDGVEDIAHGFMLLESGFVSVAFGDIVDGFKPSGQILTQGMPGSSSVGEDRDKFGSSLTAVNYDHDRCRGDLLVGSAGEDVVSSGQTRIDNGIVYLFRSTPNGLVPDGDRKLPWTGREFPWSDKARVGSFTAAGTLDNGDVIVGVDHDHNDGGLFALGDYTTSNFFTWRRSATQSGFVPVEDRGYQDVGTLMSGDFNGDRNTDFVSINTFTLFTADSVRVFLHDDEGRIREEETVNTDQLGSSQFLDVTGTSVGDFNGDRYDDVAVVDDGITDNDERIHVLYGSGAGLLGSWNRLMRPVTSFSIPNSESTWVTRMATGDLNGDGRAELALALVDTERTARVAIFYGSTDGLQTTARHVIRSPIEGDGDVQFGQVGLEIGDYNADRVDDLAIMFRGGSQGESRDAMQVHFSWARTRLEVIPSVSRVAPGQPITFQARVSRTDVSKLPLARGTVGVAIAGSGLSCSITSLTALGMGSCTVNAPSQPGHYRVIGTFRGNVGYRNSIDSSSIDVLNP